MAFDVFGATNADQGLTQKYIDEIISIAGVEIKYLPVNLSTLDVMSDGIFKGEDPDLSYRSPIIVKGIMNVPPEAAKQWEAMGFFSVDMTNIYFSKQNIIGTLGRRPMPRDRIYFTYNDTGFEITDVLEQAPREFYNTFVLEVKLKKLVEGFEDSDLYTTLYPGSQYHASAGSGISAAPSALSGIGDYPSAHVPEASREYAVSAEIEDRPATTEGISGDKLTSGFGTSDDDIFSGW